MHKNGNQENVDEYDLHEAWGDMLNDPQHYPFEADFLLQHRKLEFRIAIKPRHSLAKLYVEYFLVYDIDYRTFQTSVGNCWYQRYNLQMVSAELR